MQMGETVREDYYAKFLLVKAKPHESLANIIIGEIV